MIDIKTEKLLPLKEIAAMLPGRDGGKVHPFTVSLWARRGKQGVKLETLLAGPCRCTSLEAVQRFLEAVSRAQTDARPARVAVAAGRSERERSKAVARACAEMERAGA